MVIKKYIWNRLDIPQSKYMRNTEYPSPNGSQSEELIRNNKQYAYKS